MGGAALNLTESIKTWWADDWHIIPRFCRDIAGWLKGSQYARVGLWTITYDEQTEEQTHEYVKVARKDLPANAVHVTGKGFKEYALDLDDSGQYPKEGELNAIDLYLLASTYIYDTDQILTKRKNHNIDTKMLLLIGGGLAAAIILWYFMRIGGA